jgi:hypothetical protein
VAELFSEDGKFFNAEMVRAGMAYHYQQYSGNCPHKEAIATAEETAKRAQAGVWKYPSSQRPWDWRNQPCWGNATTDEPAFMVYLGCQKDEVKGYVQTLNTFYRTEWCEVRKPRHLKGFEAEIKVRGMQRYSDSNAFGLDYLVESESAKHFGCDYAAENLQFIG